jgi:hypothetical protein
MKTSKNVSEEKILKKFHPPFFLFLAWWPSWLEIGITGPKFGRGPSKDHSTKAWFKLAQLLQSSSCIDTFSKAKKYKKTLFYFLLI